MSFNFSSPLFNSNFNFLPPGLSKNFSNYSNNSNNNAYPVIYVPTFVPSYDNTNFQNSPTNANYQPSTNQTTFSPPTNNAAFQMMMGMMSMMMQMMQNVMNNNSSSSNPTGTSTTGVSNLDTASDTDITQAQNNIVNSFAATGSSTALNNQTLLSSIASTEPNSDASVQSEVNLINANPNSSPQAMQEFALLQALRVQNSTLNTLNTQSGYSTPISQVSNNRTQIISSLQTLQNRPLSTEELSALPLNDQVKQALLPNTLTASQIMDLNAQNDHGTTYTPPGGVYFNTSTSQPSWSQLQSQYLYYQGVA